MLSLAPLILALSAPVVADAKFTPVAAETKAAPVADAKAAPAVADAKAAPVVADAKATPASGDAKAAPASADGLAGAGPRLSVLAIPGDPAFTATARDVLGVVFALDPSAAANAGLFEDSIRAPSFAPAEVKARLFVLDESLAKLRAMPWRSWSVDGQIDFRWVYAVAESARHALAVEQRYRHRPASWLEPYSNTLIALATYAPDQPALRARLWAKLPPMLAEIPSVTTELTQRDQQTAQRLVEALEQMARAEPTLAPPSVSSALAAYKTALAAEKPAREYSVIGAEAYAFRLRRETMLPWTPAELLALAQQELARVDKELAALGPKPPKSPGPSAELTARAKELTAPGLLAAYDEVTEALRVATLKAGFVTIPPGVGPLRARETPEAMVPFTGNGGSMNPPPPFAPFEVGFWNVERFDPRWTQEERLELVAPLADFRNNGYGPYAAHEGYPGHHLQLAIARLHKNPLRSVLIDSPMVEGWGLYAEELLWRHGGLGKSERARAAMLGSYRYRIARVVYSVQVETKAWSLQEAAKFKYRSRPDQAQVDEELLRTIQWPTQLVGYFAGKQQLVALRKDYQRLKGPKFSEREFHDAVLAEGSVPLALIRAKLLGTEVPGIDEAKAW